MSYYKSQQKSRNKKHQPLLIVRKLMDITMGIVYTIIGISILYFKLHEYGYTFLAPPFKYLFGGIILIYGLFRLYRALILKR